MPPIRIGVLNIFDNLLNYNEEQSTENPETY